MEEKILQKLEQIQISLYEVGQRLDNIEQRLDRIEERMDELEKQREHDWTRFAVEIDDIINRLDKQFDEKLEPIRKIVDVHTYDIMNLRAKTAIATEEGTLYSADGEEKL